MKYKDDWYNAYAFANIHSIYIVKQKSKIEELWWLIEQNMISRMIEKNVNEIKPNTALPCLLNEL